MLVLSRKEGEEVVIGGNLRLTVVAIRGNQVRLGFTGPPDVSIQREELRQQAEGFGTLAVRPATSETEPLTGHTSAAVILPPGLLEMEQLETHVQSRLNGRVRHFRLVLRGCGLILKGHARTYYARQLAQHVVTEATALPILVNEIEVD